MQIICVSKCKGRLVVGFATPFPPHCPCLPEFTPSSFLSISLEPSEESLLLAREYSSSQPGFQIRKPGIAKHETAGASLKCVRSHDGTQLFYDSITVLSLLIIPTIIIPAMLFSFFKHNSLLTVRKFAKGKYLMS